MNDLRSEEALMRQWEQITKILQEAAWDIALTSRAFGEEVKVSETYSYKKPSTETLEKIRVALDRIEYILT